MLFDEHLRDAVVQERRHQLAEGLRLLRVRPPAPRPGGPLASPAGRAVDHAGPDAGPRRHGSPERTTPPLVGIRRTMPDMYR